MVQISAEKPFIIESVIEKIRQQKYPSRSLQEKEKQN